MKAGDRLKSMTGYGRARKIANGREITVEIRSVNHRYYECSSRIPRTYGYIEDTLKNILKSSISRGKVELSVTIVNMETSDVKITMNHDVAKGYAFALRDMSDVFCRNDDLTLAVLSRMPDVFTVRKKPENEDEITGDTAETLKEALTGFINMRETEGERLREDILLKTKNLKEMLSQVEKLSPMTVEKYRKRLFQKLSEILDGKDIDQQRILTESAIFAEKIAVDEETVRLASHIRQLESMLESDEPVGRKLDFIVQEINREINTIGSKAQDVEITALVIDMKAETEKIREQIQNIE